MANPLRVPVTRSPMPEVKHLPLLVVRSATKTQVILLTWLVTVGQIPAALRTLLATNVCSPLLIALCLLLVPQQTTDGLNDLRLRLHQVAVGRRSLG